MPSPVGGLAVTTGVLVAVAVSAPLFVAAAGESSWRQDRDRLSPTVLGTTLSTTTLPRVVNAGSHASRITHLPDLDRSLRSEVGDLGFAAPTALTVAVQLTATGPGDAGPAQLLSRTGAETHVRIVAGAASASGVLVPSDLAAATGLSPGGFLTLTPRSGAATSGPGARLLVSGVYERPTAPLPEFWEGQGYRLFLPRPAPGGDAIETYPDAPVIAAPEVVRRVASALDVPVAAEWYFPPPHAMSRATAQAVAQRSRTLEQRLLSPEDPVGQQAALVGQPLLLRTSLPSVLQGADSTVALLRRPVRAVGVGGAGAALLLVGVWAGQRMRRRKVQLRALVARGLSPREAATRSLVESLAPVVTGTVLGSATGLAAVVLLGPVGALPGGWWGRLWPTAAWCAGGALVVVTLVAAVSVARMGQVGVGAAQQLLGRVPWVPVIAAVAVVAGVPLARGGGSPDQGLGVLTLGAPLLVVASAAAVVVALLQRVAPRCRGVLDRLPTGMFLGARRVLAATEATRLVVVGTAVSLALVAYAGVLAASTARTVQAKAVVAVGSDFRVRFSSYPPVTGLPQHSTLLQTTRTLKVLPGDTEGNLLALQPQEFLQVAGWDSSFADRSLPELLAALQPTAGTAAATSGRVPVLVAGDLPAGMPTATAGEVTLEMGTVRVPAQVVAHARAFPGMPSVEPLVVAAQGPLTKALADLGQDPGMLLAKEVWGRGDPAPVLAALASLPSVSSATVATTTAQDFASRPELRAQTWTLGYLRAVAGTAGLLGLTGLLLYAAAQQRRRTVATVLLSRMGLSRASARASAAVELGVLATVSATVGVALALPLSRLVLARLDPVPSLPPAPLFAVPVTTLALLVLAVAVLVVLGALSVDWVARRTPGGDVLRGA